MVIPIWTNFFFNWNGDSNLNQIFLFLKGHIKNFWLIMRHV